MRARQRSQDAPALAGGMAARRTRPPFTRMIRLHQLLQQGRYPNCRRLAAELEVSTKTVQRDIDFMRDQMELPIEYDYAEKGFFYTQEVVQFPSLQMTESELVALFVARRALEQYRGTAFEKPLCAAFEKLTAGLTDQIGFAWEDLSVTFHPGTHGRGTADLRVFQSVSQGVWRQEELEFDYRKVSAKTGQGAERRRVRGLHLGCFDNQWYLFAQDLVRGAIRTFVLGRMERVKNTGKRFKRPPGFSLDGLLAGSFGVFSAPRLEQLRLRFDSVAGRLVRERIWHRTQQLRNLPKGALELTLEVGVSPEVERWLLGWGDHVEVLAPPALRSWMEQTALQMAARHAGAPREIEAWNHNIHSPNLA
jgi:predicted DNA-binding transcriptional regulator YafY